MNKHRFAQAPQHTQGADALHAKAFRHAARQCVVQQDRAAGKIHRQSNRLGFAAIHTTAGDTPTDFTGGDVLTREWTPWLLIVLLSFVAFETFLAWFCDQAPAAGPTPGLAVRGQV